VPDLFFKELEQQRKRLIEAEQAYGTNTISPFLFQA
jgi:hypothetical protein